MAEVLEQEVKVKAPAEPLFSKKNRRLITDPLNDNNPITVQVLGICSALAVTVSMKNAFIMTLAVIFVITLSNLIVSLIRNAIPSRIRLIVQLVVIATLVTIVSEVLKAYAFTSYKELSVYIGLIITNCIVMGRLEAFAMGNKPWASILDGIGNGLGYGAILIIVAFFREFFGKGSLFGKQILGDWYEPNGLLVLPVSALFVVGALIWIHRAWRKNLVDIS
ncbi:MAG: NADH:ubiquinone reductase (Na(+)-transporting) subunit D [Saprospiraceae bacterium]|nr:NADH:ubiquinone reductase (Na(+)-transporting) subunit D [Saprospiraceae bacterium]